MIIKSVHIEKFRGFEDVTVELGKKVTAIAGQNGTQKSTLLGIIAQPFSTTMPPLSKSKTLDNAKFKTEFGEKFKLSEEYDKAGQHSFTLNFYDGKSKNYNSFQRLDDTTKHHLRFWQTTGGRQRGTGYTQCPIIFLSLKRLTPIGEENLDTKLKVPLTPEEEKIYEQWHRKVLSIRDSLSGIETISSEFKSTLAPKTGYYDPVSISAGQDSLGKIILAILSFRRLGIEYKDDYMGGILLIDELDSTLFPAAQSQLLNRLFSIASKYKIQIVFTTHSPTILEAMSNEQYREHGKIVYLTKRDKKIKAENVDYSTIWNDLHLTVAPKPQRKKIRVYTEDPETRLFAKYLLGRSKKYSIEWPAVKMGCSAYLELIRIKVSEFCLSLIVLDGDAKNAVKGKGYQNVLTLPGNVAPEELFYNYLDGFSEDDPFWDGTGGYTKQICFKEFAEFPGERKKNKEWFNTQIPYWGAGGSKLFKKWKEDNPKQAEQFCEEFDRVYNKLVRILEGKRKGKK